MSRIIVTPLFTQVCGCIIRRNISSTSHLSRLKSEWRVDRKPANTKLAVDINDIVEQRKAFGGRKKWKAVSISHGNYSFAKLDIEKRLPILDVVHSDAGRKYRNEKILVKGAYVVVDGSTIKSDITVEMLLESDTFTEEYIKHVSDMLVNGKLYAKVTSRPGQVGTCDGVIAEGTELFRLMEKLKIYND